MASKPKPVSISAAKTPDVPIWEKPFELPVGKSCPKCGETIRFVAVVCRYCGEEFTNIASETERLQRDFNALVKEKKEEYESLQKEKHRLDEERKRKKARHNIGLIFTLIIIVVAVMLLYMKPNVLQPVMTLFQSKDTTQSPQPRVITPKQRVNTQSPQRLKGKPNKSKQVSSKEPVRSVHRWFVKIRYPSGSEAIFKLQDEFPDKHVVGDTVKPSRLGDNWYLTEPNEIVRGVIIAKFDSLVSQ